MCTCVNMSVYPLYRSYLLLCRYILYNIVSNRIVRFQKRAEAEKWRDGLQAWKDYAIDYSEYRCQLRSDRSDCVLLMNRRL